MRMKMRWFKAAIFGALWLAVGLKAADAQPFTMDWHQISGGGGMSTNGQYAVTGTIGQPDAGGAMSGGSYSVTGGFWSLIAAVQTIGAPALTVACSGGRVTVSWPSASTGLVLQQNSNLATANWTTSGYTISTASGTNSITIISPAGNLFFRLAAP